MSLLNLYTDFWYLLGEYLNSDDLWNFSLTCKGAWKACQKPILKNKMSYPMSIPYHLTHEQRSTIKQMEKHTGQRFKLINGEVGCGKTIVSLSYAIRNYTDPDAKIVMCGPPSLIKMWWDTLKKYFGIDPLVLHGTNPKYTKGSWNTAPDRKFILVSYLLLGREHNTGWFNSNRDLLIIDEAHHHTNAPFNQFKEVIGLSATTTKKSGVSAGIRHILNSFNLNMDDCTYELSKNIISKALPPVQYHIYQSEVPGYILTSCKNLIKYTKKGEQDVRQALTICNLLSHPECFDLRDEFTLGYVMMGRKKLSVDDGNVNARHELRNKLHAEYPELDDQAIRKKLEESVTFNIMKKNYPKYLQVLEIVREANKKGEKVVVFDNNITYLPFLLKFLHGNGINCYLFTTHYDVIGRQRQFEKFKQDKAGVLLSSISMFGEGQNAPEANHVVLYSQNLDGTKYYQAVGRCWRYPQNKTVHVHLLFAGEFERKVYEHACGATDLNNYNWLELL